MKIAIGRQPPRKKALGMSSQPSIDIAPVFHAQHDDRDPLLLDRIQDYVVLARMNTPDAGCPASSRVPGRLGSSASKSIHLPIRF